MTSRTPLQRQAIVEAARDLVAAEGLDALSLRRLATILGVTAPALYAHVDNKEDLLRAVAADRFNELVARYEVAASSPLGRVRSQSRAYIGLARENPHLFQVMFLFPPDLGMGAALPDDLELPAATQAFNLAAQAVVDAVDAGELVTDDPLIVALALWSAVHGVAGVLLLGLELPEDLAERLIDEVIDHVIAGYRP